MAKIYTFTANARLGWKGTVEVTAQNKTIARKEARRILSRKAISEVSALAFTSFIESAPARPAA